MRLSFSLCLISGVNFSLKIASCICVNFSHGHDNGFEFIDHFSKPPELTLDYVGNIVTFIAGFVFRQIMKF